MLSWRIFLQTESVIVLMCHWWDKCSTLSLYFLAKLDTREAFGAIVAPHVPGLCMCCTPDKTTEDSWFVSRHVIV